MTGQIVYELIKFWLPILGAAAMLYRGARAARTGISAWANQLLDNHMAHIQKAAEDGALSLHEMSTSNIELVGEMRGMRTDFQRSYDENARNTQAILTGVEVLKDRG